MISRIEKYTLEAYGLLRITLGVAQIVGLCASYFFLEFILKYPLQNVSFVLNEDIIVLTYLAIVFRALFHVFAGIGVARLSNRVRMWLLFGWPIMFVVTIGLGYTIAQSWILEGKASTLFEVLAWPKLFLYCLFIVLDWVWVNNAIARFNQAKSNEKNGGTLKLNQIMIFLFLAVCFFVILIFLGKPMRQGFHQGFYKSRGVVQKPSRSYSKEVTSVKLSKTKEFEDTENKGKNFLNLDGMMSNETPLNDESSNNRVSESKEEFDYKNAISIVGGLLLILGMIFQLRDIFKTRQTEGISALGYCAWGISSGVLSFFSFVSGQIFFSLVAGAVGVGCGVVVLMVLKK